ncbi:MAG: hypothetical protein ACYTEQ_25050 [Planctomycetota bacterium]|jgi:hypothetical protein
MKEESDILKKAVDALKNMPVSHGPPGELAGAVAEKCAHAAGQAQPEGVGASMRSLPFAKVAVAAVLLVVAGYAVGRLTTPQPPDAEQLRSTLEASLKSSLEPAIRQNLLEELERNWQLALAGSYVGLKDQLNQQFRTELNEFGAHILAASGNITNQRLTQLIEAIDAAQAQERRWITAALEQIESNRRQDRQQLFNGLESLAVYTGDELTRTRQDVAQFLVYTRPDSPARNVSENSHDSMERSKK